MNVKHGTVQIQLPVQWGDQDALGHVNNIVYFRWFESVRLAYFHKLASFPEHSPDGTGLILAAASCDYHLPLTYPDTVHVGAQVTRIGRTSIQMAYSACSESLQQPVATGDSTIVVFDYQANQPMPVSDAMRAEISQLESQEF